MLGTSLKLELMTTTLEPQTLVFDDHLDLSGAKEKEIELHTVIKSSSFWDWLVAPLSPPRTPWLQLFLPNQLQTSLISRTILQLPLGDVT